MKQTRERIWLPAICLAQAGAVLVFLNFAGALSLIQNEWQLSNSQAGAIQAAGQLGYLLAVLVLSSLTDFTAAERLVTGGALVAGLGNVGFALLAQNVPSAIFFRVLVGIGVAGIYMPGMKIISQRLPNARRGRAVGLFVASFTVGSAASLALGGTLAALLGWRQAFVLLSLGPLIGLVAAIAVRPAPHAPVEPGVGTERAQSMAQLLQSRGTLLAIAVYAAHVWELFGLRSWLPAFLASAFAGHGMALATATQNGANVAGLGTLLGATSIVVAATLSDKFGRTRTIMTIATLGAFCTLGLGFVHAWPTTWLIVIALVTTFMSTADSAVISTTLTEIVPAHYLGRTLALYSFSGFLAGSISPLVFGAVLDLTGNNWRWALASLALGGILALVAARHLHRYQKGNGFPAAPGVSQPR